MRPLPAWVRRSWRVDYWVWAKLIINAAHILRKQGLPPRLHDVGCPGLCCSGPSGRRHHSPFTKWSARLMKPRNRWDLPALVLLLAVSGCGGPLVNASGRLTYKGQPVPSTLVTFWPQEEGKRASTGVTDDDGKFTLSYSRTEPGVLVGRHTV